MKEDCNGLVSGSHRSQPASPLNCTCVVGIRVAATNGRHRFVSDVCAIATVRCAVQFLATEFNRAPRCNPPRQGAPVPFDACAGSAARTIVSLHVAVKRIGRPALTLPSPGIFARLRRRCRPVARHGSRRCCGTGRPQPGGRFSLPQILTSGKPRPPTQGALGLMRSPLEVGGDGRAENAPESQKPELKAL
jgi:hypothetical protein